MGLEPNFLETQEHQKAEAGFGASPVIVAATRSCSLFGTKGWAVPLHSPSLCLQLCFSNPFCRRRHSEGFSGAAVGQPVLVTEVGAAKWLRFPLHAGLQCGPHQLLGENPLSVGPGLCCCAHGGGDQNSGVCSG